MSENIKITGDVYGKEEQQEKNIPRKAKVRGKSFRSTGCTDLTFEQVCRKYGIDPERIRQIEAKTENKRRFAVGRMYFKP